MRELRLACGLTLDREGFCAFSGSPLGHALVLGLTVLKPFVSLKRRKPSRLRVAQYPPIDGDYRV